MLMFVRGTRRGRYPGASFVTRCMRCLLSTLDFVVKGTEEASKGTRKICPMFACYKASTSTLVAHWLSRPRTFARSDVLL